MNSKSENAVQNIKADTTSEERSQAHSPVVISRRRLLRAGVSGIPILLTMNGIAPAQSIVIGASAASAMNYDRHNVYETFNTYSNDSNLVWTDENGFILKSKGGEHYISDVKAFVKSSVQTAQVTLYPPNYSSEDPQSTDQPKNFNITCSDNVQIGTFDYYLRKCPENTLNASLDNWYTDLKLNSKDTNSSTVQEYVTNNLSDFITIPDGVDFDFHATPAKYSVTCEPTSVVTSSKVNGADNINYYRAKDFGSSPGTVIYNITVTLDTGSLTYQDGVTYSNTAPVLLNFTLSLTDQQTVSGSGEPAQGDPFGDE